MAAVGLTTRHIHRFFMWQPAHSAPNSGHWLLVLGHGNFWGPLPVSMRQLKTPSGGRLPSVSLWGYFKYCGPLPQKRGIEDDRWGENSVTPCKMRWCWGRPFDSSGWKKKGFSLWGCLAKSEMTGERCFSTTSKVAGSCIKHVWKLNLIN